MKNTPRHTRRPIPAAPLTPDEKVTAEALLNSWLYGKDSQGRSADLEAANLLVEIDRRYYGRPAKRKPS